MIDSTFYKFLNFNIKALIMYFDIKIKKFITRGVEKLNLTSGSLIYSQLFFFLHFYLARESNRNRLLSRTIKHLFPKLF